MAGGDGEDPSLDDLSASQQQEAFVRKRTFWPLVLLASGLAVGLAALFFPVASVTDSACTVELIELAALRAPLEGVVAYDVQPGQMVSVGQVVAHIENTELAQEVALHKTEIMAAQAALAELEAGSRPEEIAQGEKQGTP